MPIDARSNSLLLGIDEHIARVVLNCPPVNALNHELVKELHAAAKSLHRRSDVWLVTVTSALPVFCAGADLKERASLPASRVAASVKNIQRMVRAWWQLPQPVLMAVNGAALGGGLEFALAGDLILASTDAQLGFPEVRLGIIPAGGGTRLLPMRTSLAIAGKWILSGRKFTAEEALSDSVIDFVVPGNTFVREVDQITGMLMSNAPLALRQAKRALRLQAQAMMRVGWNQESRCYAPLIRSKDRAEALKAFLEKRTAEWKGM